MRDRRIAASVTRLSFSGLRTVYNPAIQITRRHTVTKQIITGMLILLTNASVCLAEMNTSRILDAAMQGAVNQAFTEAEKQIINNYFSHSQESPDDQNHGKGKKQKKSKKTEKAQGITARTGQEKTASSRSSKATGTQRYLATRAGKTLAPHRPATTTSSCCRWSGQSHC